MRVPQNFAGPLNLSLDPRLAGYDSLEEKRSQAERLLKAYSWKSGLKKGFPLIVSLLGGTGTGKSTLFNSLAGASISNVGIRRPWTLKAVLLAHEEAVPELDQCPYLDQQGQSGAVLVTHRDPGLRQLILVDTPDFDSVELANRFIADDYFVVSDLIIFVTSQEKYADLKGLQMWRRARQWGKNTLFVLNKTESRDAYDDFHRILSELGFGSAPVLVECLENFPELIPGLRDRAGFHTLFSCGELENAREELRGAELTLLARNAVGALEDVENSVAAQRGRIFSVISDIDAILNSVAGRMEAGLDEVLTEDLQDRIRIRLQELLRKYDFLFGPRMKIRNALRGLFHSIIGILAPGEQGDSGRSGEEEARVDDLHRTRSAAQLRPVEAAVADLNRRVAQMLASDLKLGDLREVALGSVPRWSATEIRSQYEEAFPGLEHVLEHEFNRLRDGLSRLDELKLYGTNTLWAVLLVTAEVVVGGGFTLLDAMLDSVVFPFIPKWMLDVQVRDSLRDIARRVDQEHRRVLTGILRQQAELYKAAFVGLLPSEESFRGLEELREGLARHVDGSA